MKKESLPVRSYKGTRDFYPRDMCYRNWYFSKVREIVESFGYEEYHTPLLESYDMYAAKSGDEVANEQLYLFEDKGGRKVAIRPEMTPSVARLVAARLDELNFPLRWYSIANFMRYEKPQKGRLREHWQVNVDIFGADEIDAELEIISIIKDIMEAFRADPEMFKIKINNRKFFNDVLVDILDVKTEDIKKISRVVDKKAKMDPEKYNDWLKEIGLSKEKIDLLDKIFSSNFADIVQMMHIDSKGARELYELFRLLNETGLEDYYEFDFSIVRGFDYYTGTVFEVYDTSPGNRRSLFGGGRYDNLVSLYKEKNITGIGFGLGDVTFQHFLEGHDLIPKTIYASPAVLITRFLEVPVNEYIHCAKQLRSENIRTAVYFSGNDKLGQQLKFAEKKGFSIALILGIDELKENKITIKHLDSKTQVTVDRNEYIDKVKEFLNSGLK
ncbi:MAG: histidine--tRNA ligase [Spirochaetales bacterium]|nr:histidine--tRNA ligase [Spirochaetales bacterium]